MRPHRLEMEAFGPYAAPVALAFDGLSEEGLFLIHGSTGSGKTFLLDALCFALYGEVSGDRNLKGLRSDHAAPGMAPRVSLEFSAGGSRYRVERTAAHSAPKARGQGTTDKPPQAVLFRLQGGQQAPLASRAMEVTREVEGLVGLTATQFRQVILLPQGKFAEVLRARAEERESLLKTLFHTVVFERAGQWLEERARSARMAQLEGARAQEVLRQQAAQEWSPYRSAGEEEIVPADQGALDQLVERIEAVSTAAAIGHQEASQRLEAAQRLKQATDLLRDRWQRRSAASARLAELEGKAEVVEAYRQRWRTGEQAEALRPSVEAERSAREALAAVEERLAKLRRRALQLRDRIPALPVAVTRLDLAGETNLEALQEASQALAARRAEVSQLVRQAREAAEARAQVQQGSLQLKAMETTLGETQAALDSRQGERLACLEAAARARTARDQLQGLQQAAQEAQQLAQAVAAIGPAQEREAAAIRVQGQAEARLKQTKADFLALRKRQLDGMAAHLAKGLVAGQPCPVCGSNSHPAPQGDEGDAVGEVEINAAEQEMGAATQAAQDMAASLAAAREALKGVMERAGEAAGAPQQAQAAAKEALAAWEAARAMAQKVEPLEQAIATHEQALAAAQEQLQALRTQIALLRSTTQEAQEKAKGLEAELRRELGEGVDPVAVLEAFRPLEEGLKELASGCQVRNQTASRLAEAAARLEQQLQGSAFDSGEAVAAALEGADVTKRQQWATRIVAYEKEVVELKGALAAADLVDLPDAEPDWEQAERALREADQARVQALERWSEAKGTQRDLERLAEAHRKGDQKARTLQEDAELVVAVAERCQGKAAPYISLQRWVLSAYLEDICRYANQRLELMTSSRYQLRISDEGGRGGRQAGLGLRVLDAYTGEEREVNSLSGGETFQASLALALAVADTVEARAGGLHLEALFIDEGFGTLDPENLQLAMDELDRLREGGRMIGIISHVGALKERIRAGIEVRAGENGSTAQVVRTVME